jgi:hypothetical protein
MNMTQSRIDKKRKEKKKCPCAFRLMWYILIMKNESGYLMAIEKGIEAWTDFLGGRLVFRVEFNGKILTFNGDDALKNWVLSL